ncbi:MAG TPA: response regulator [Terracidiphilus sp.]|nr:response regulator [Terracidiphilus sp.]
MTISDLEVQETVFIVDDDPSVCEGLSNLVESAGLCAQSYSTAEEFFENWHDGMAGCLVLDLRLPRMSGLDLQVKLAESQMKIPVIIMSAYADIATVRNALKRGAVEFLVKPFQDAELLLAVEQAFALDRERRQRDDVVNSIKSRFETLTEREREVLELVTAGFLNKQIADKLCLSLVTVKMHRGQVMKKMGVKTVPDLVRMWGAFRGFRS